MNEPYSLYASPDSASFVIRMLLNELGLPFETIWVDRSSQEHKQADYLALNPQGLIPVLVDDGQAIFETAAIALYLCEKHSALMPQSSQGRAGFYQWLFYLSNTLHADLRVRFYGKNYINGEKEQAALLVGMKSRITGHLELIETELVNNAYEPWFLGESLSALDIYLAALCRWWQLYPVTDQVPVISQQTLPRIHHILVELAKRPAIQAACAEENILTPFFIDPKMPDLPADKIIG
ncbi:MAG: glutathione S-transferase family protein [Pseudomonadota bacterium]